MTDDLARRVAEAKRRVAEAQSKLAIKDNPYMVRRFDLVSNFTYLFPSLSVYASDREEEPSSRTFAARSWFEDGGSPTSPRHNTGRSSVQERSL